MATYSYLPLRLTALLFLVLVATPFAGCSGTNTRTQASGASPTSTVVVPPNLDGLDALWANSDWDKIIALLEQVRSANVMDQPLWDKLYAAYVNAGVSALKSGNKDIAKTRFTSALRINPYGSETKAYLDQIDPPAPLAERLDALWAKSDWDGVVNLLEGAKEAPEWKPELSIKLYAAYVNIAQAAFNTGRYNDAKRQYQAALKANPNGGEAKLGIVSADNALAEAAASQARAGSTLELLSVKCTFERFGNFGGYAYIEGQVKNISGRSIRNVQAVATWSTENDSFITSDTALIEYNPLLPSQTSPFKTITRLNPEMKRCAVEFKELLGGSLPTYYRP